MTGEPRVAVLIPVHGALDRLAECLESLAAVATTTAYDVTIVDDATPGGLGDLPRRYKIDSLLTRFNKGGFTAAVNEGLHRAFSDHDACVLLNSDMRVLPGWIDALAARWHAESRVGIVGGMELSAEDPDRIVAGGTRPLFARGELTSLLHLDRTGSLRAGDLQAAERLDWVSFGIALISRACWQAVGDLDGCFSNYFSDADYGYRANLAGFSVWYEPQSRVLHWRHQTTRLAEQNGLMNLQADRERYCRKWFPGGLPTGRDERRWALKSRRAWYPRLIPHLGRLSPLNHIARAHLLDNADIRRDVETALAAEGRSKLWTHELHAYRRLYSRGLAFIEFVYPSSVCYDGVPTDRSQVVVFAPHPDDAALSVGGFLLARRHIGAHTHVHVLFGRSHHAVGSFAGLPESDVSFVRAFEEAAWCGWAGAEFSIDPLPDRLVRLPSASMFLDGVAELEEDMVRPVLAAMEARVAGYGAHLPTLMCPLAAALLADHAIVAHALSLLVARGYPPDRVLLYDDLPYVTIPGAVRAGLELYEHLGLIPSAVATDITPWFDQKIELLSIHASQVHDHMLCAVEQCGQAPMVNGDPGSRRTERFWTVEVRNGRSAH